MSYSTALNNGGHECQIVPNAEYAPKLEYLDILVKMVNISLYNGNGQLMTNEGNFEEVAEFKYLGPAALGRVLCGPARVFKKIQCFMNIEA